MPTVLTVGFEAGSSAHSRLASQSRSLRRPALARSLLRPDAARQHQKKPEKKEREKRHKREKKPTQISPNYPMSRCGFQHPHHHTIWPKYRMWRRLARSCQATPSLNPSPRLAGSGQFGDGPCREPQSRQLSPVSTTAVPSLSVAASAPHRATCATVSQPGPWLHPTSGDIQRPPWPKMSLSLQHSAPPVALVVHNPRPVVATSLC